MEAFITHLDSLPGTHVISRYNAGIRAQRLAYQAAHPGALESPATTAQRITRGRSYLSRLAGLALTTVAWELLSANVSAMEMAATNQNFRLFVQALSDGNLIEAERRLGRVGGTGFLQELATSGGNATLAVATAYENAWIGARERAIQNAAAINRGN